jgi:hypothetical protein
MFGFDNRFHQVCPFFEFSFPLSPDRIRGPWERVIRLDTTVSDQRVFSVRFGLRGPHGRPPRRQFSSVTTAAFCIEMGI